MKLIFNIIFYALGLEAFHYGKIFAAESSQISFSHNRFSQIWKNIEEIWKSSAAGSIKPLVPLVCLGLWGGGSQDRRKRYHHVLAVTWKYIKVKGIGPKILTVVQMACVGETWECLMRNHTKLRCYRNKRQNRKRGKCITDSARHARQHFINIRWKKSWSIFPLRSGITCHVEQDWCTNDILHLEFLLSERYLYLLVIGLALS